MCYENYSLDILTDADVVVRIPLISYTTTHPLQPVKLN